MLTGSSAQLRGAAASIPAPPARHPCKNLRRDTDIGGSFLLTRLFEDQVLPNRYLLLPVTVAVRSFPHGKGDRGPLARGQRRTVVGRGDIERASHEYGPT